MINNNNTSVQIKSLEERFKSMKQLRQYFSHVHGLYYPNLPVFNSAFGLLVLTGHKLLLKHSEVSVPTFGEVKKVVELKKRNNIKKFNARRINKKILA